MRILVATDGSAPAQTAIDLVAGRRWAADTLVRVVAVDDAYGEDRAELEAHVAAAVRQLRAAGLEVEFALWAGRAASILIGDATTWGADLLVVGCRGRGRIESLVLGSVSAEVVERARCSVLVVRRPRIDRLLVAVDGSAPSNAVAPFLCATGTLHGTTTVVVSVSREADPWPPSLDLLAARAATRAEAQLAGCGLTVRREVLVGEPAAAILARAGQDDADLVALGSRGISGLRRLLIGSVARNVAWSASANVIVVRRFRRTSEPAR